MTYVVKVRGAGGLVVAEYECPEHGRFTATLHREANGDPPEVQCCHVAIARCTCVHPDDTCGPDCIDECGIAAPWRPSSVRGWVKRGEVARGKSDVQEQPTWMSTRELGEGMPLDEWEAKRDKAWEEYDRKEDKELFG